LNLRAKFKQKDLAVLKTPPLKALNASLTPFV